MIDSVRTRIVRAASAIIFLMLAVQSAWAQVYFPPDVLAPPVNGVGGRARNLRCQAVEPALFQQRFGLAVHEETIEKAVYSLERQKSGAKLKHAGAEKSPQLLKKCSKVVPGQPIPKET